MNCSANAWAMAVVALLAACTPAAEPPRVVLVNPPTLTPQKKTVLTVRGHGLDVAEGVQFSVPPAAGVKIQSKGKSQPPAQLDAKVYGDSEVKVEVELPRETPPGPVTLVVTGPAHVWG